MLTFLLLVRDGCGEENRGAEQHSAKEGLCHRGAGDGEGERGGITMGRFNIVLKHDLEAMQNLHHVVSTSPALSNISITSVSIIRTIMVIRTDKCPKCC